MAGALACHNCKRRKIKCDRQLPECAFCRERSQQCEYPSEARKPGPKPGTRKRTSVLSATSDSDARLNGSSSLRHAADNSAAYPSPSELHAGVDTTSPINSFAGVTPESNLLSRMIHPSHETRPPSETDAAGSLIELGIVPGQTDYTRMVGGVCTAFDISPQEYDNLLNAYFDNMTAFSLFHRPRFETKLCTIASSKQLQALLAAMFAFSIRFVHQTAFQFPASRFHQLAQQLIAECIAECEEDAPPLCILQAMVLTSFQQLTKCVRGRSWRSLGDCIRIALELRLHQIDQDDAKSTTSTEPAPNAAEWVSKEEKRRAWWAIWELDVFASTIRCLPTGISWQSNYTRLPVDNKDWFSCTPTNSCWLVDDPSIRWKLLEQSGNRSACAWFIVANSLMRNAQMLSAHVDPGSLKNSKFPDSPGTMRTLASERTIIENSVTCLTIALPNELACRQDYLSFSEQRSPDGLAMSYADSARYSVHMMIQLSRLMIHRHEVFWHAHRILRSAEDDPARGESSGKGRRPSVTDSTMSELRSWNHYLDAANSIVNVVRSSSQNHVKHVNPCLANTIWLAAAAQVLCTVFGPEQTDRRVAESNLDLLRSTFKLYVSFWDLDPSLQERLDSLEASLQGLKSRKDARMIDLQRSKQFPLSNGAPSGMEKLLDNAPNPGPHDSLPQLDPMILGNDPSLPMGPFDPFADPTDTYSPFTIDLDELFAYGYA
jgi:Fungal specific transcription factor domain/Fungal Zn(2)-Cys(6) binuclear cluster domain